jgi:hypothetical protein
VLGGETGPLDLVEDTHTDKPSQEQNEAFAPVLGTSVREEA